MLQEYGYEVRFKLPEDEDRREESRIYKEIMDFERALNRKLRQRRKRPVNNQLPRK